MDKRIGYKIVLDVETANGLEDALPYDLGVFVVDRNGNIYERRSFVLREIFVGSRDLMESAYYANKIPRYVIDLQEGTRKMVNTFEARREVLGLMKKYNTQTVCAYNANFDITALNNLVRLLTGSRCRFFFPYGTKVECIWHMATQTICQQKAYKRFVTENGYTFNNGKNGRSTAQIVYRYLTQDNGFEESHTGAEDVEIETYIMSRCYAQHKKMNKGINRGCWRLVTGM